MCCLVPKPIHTRCEGQLQASIFFSLCRDYVFMNLFENDKCFSKFPVIWIIENSTVGCECKSAQQLLNFSL